VEDKILQQAQLLSNRLQKRFRHLKKWALRNGIGAFRLYDRDIPEIPIVLDFFGDPSILQESAISGALYKRPYEKDAAEETKWLLVMKESVAKAIGINPEHIYIKLRQRKKDFLQYEKINDKQFTKIINEGGLSFKVNLSDYLDTGIFPDRRLLKSLIRNESSGKKVLNLFAYTGSFSVYASAGGAISTDSVDISNTYLSWARDNFSLNGFSTTKLQQWDFFAPENTRAFQAAGSEIPSVPTKNCVNNLIRADVLVFLEKAIEAKMCWDIIIIDPPSFSNSKKMTENFDLNRDITGLVNQCLFLLSPAGKIFLSMNIRRSAPTAEELKAEINHISPRKNIVQITDLSDKMIDEDFKNKKLPRTFLVQ
jgi:23S rRNA G2069 N7-methylase RlmK/C1962 C5-methylase RlmI